MADVHYTLAISGEALEQLRALPKEQRRRLGDRLAKLQDNLSGDVKKLSAKEQKYRLRVGDYCVPPRAPPAGRQADFGVCSERQERSL